MLQASIAEMAVRIKAREVSPVELTDAALAHAEQLQPSLQSFITLLPDQARAQANERERAIAKGEYRGPLDGIPIGIKDNIATAGIRTTVGSKVLAEHVPDEDAFVVRRAKEAGAIILGKENMHEWAAGGTSTNPFYGAVHNPWNLDHVPGGSSGGGAANVAACVTFASLGTDHAGSVRGPASYCGLVGIKPTYGRVSQRGLLGTSFDGDHIGPLTRTVLDNALVLQVMAGHDPLDPTSVPVPVPDFAADLGEGLTGLKVGVPRDYFFDVIDPEVESAIRAAIGALEELGAEVRDVRLETLEHADLLRIAASAEGYSVHEPYLADHHDDYTPALLHRYWGAAFIPATDYIKSLKLQRLVQEDFARTLQEVDVLVTPTNPTRAPLIGSHTFPIGGVEHGGAAVGVNMGIRNTHITNVTGHPSISVPCGFSNGGLPIGLQLIGRPFEEALLYRVASLYERVSPSAGKLPPIVEQAAAQ
jgi:aspartyl-tRNA(Asn)/glutamyl-tRNA(Gln) amidotransferase subunit A